jgi:hypothetical protein
MKHLGAVLASLSFAACGVQASETIVPPAKTEEPAAASAATATPKSDAPAAAAHKLGDPLTFTPASDWVVEQPSSKMRVAQYKLPKAAGDAEDAELVVFHFGSMGGGSVDDNVARWASQFEQPDGGKSAERVERSQRTVNGIPVTEVRLSGTSVAETAPGSGVRVNKPGFAMLAAIYDNGESDYYAKLVGPAATVEHHTGAFREFISRAK